MAITTTLAACSQIANNNGPDGTVDPPGSLDDAIRASLSFIAILRDTKANIASPTFTGTTTVASLAFNDGTKLGTSASLAKPNLVLNGNFDVWQAGTLLASGTGARYLADQWQHNSGGSTYTASQQSYVVGQTAVPNEPQFFNRSVVTSVAGVGNFALLVQTIENVRNYAGKTVTLSFYAKADTAKNIAIEYVQGFGSGGTPSAAVGSIGVTTIALTTAFQKFTIITAIPSISGKVIGTTDFTSSTQLVFWFDAGSNFNTRTNSLGQQSGTFDISQVWIEEGSVSTTFPLRAYGQELGFCQRYYEIGNGRVDAYNIAANLISFLYPFKITKRITPTVTLSNSGYGNASGAVIDPTITTAACELTAVVTATGSAAFATTITADARF